MKRVYPREEFCIACGLCQVHCLVAHSRSHDIIRAFRRESPRALSRIKVEKKGSISLALLCRHCAEPWCVFACLTGALHRDSQTGVVSVNRERCIGCWTCVVACPYGVIIPDQEQRRIAKCDLCPNLEIPACVANCPNEALVYEENMN